MLNLSRIVQKIKNSDVPVLIQGETGTGKELLAEEIFSTSKRAKGKFVKINCAAIPENLIESELFGHTRGAFTGANQAKTGLFEYANNGTMFLDEIGDLNNIAQTKLLRVTQDGSFRKVGGNDETVTNVRLICATNKDLTSVGFRRDLYYRLAVVVLSIPPLRERPDDIELLVNYFAPKYAEKLQVEYRGITPDAMQKLIKYDWPGNVRELENMIYQAVLISDGQITGENISLVAPASAFISRQIALNEGDLDIMENEKRLMAIAMHRTGGMQKDAAALLGISPRVMSYKLILYGMRQSRKGRS
jgi:transcriptional regulator with PAS, ATPase and Fis domain